MIKVAVHRLAKRYNEIHHHLSKNSIKSFLLTPHKALKAGLGASLVLFAVYSGIKADQTAYFERAVLFLSYRLAALEAYSFQVLASATMNRLLFRYAHAAEQYQIAEWNTPFSEYLEGLAGSDDFVYDAFFFPIPDTPKAALTMRENLSFSEKNILRSEPYLNALLHSEGQSLWFSTEKGLFLARLIRNLQTGEPIGVLCFVIDVPSIMQSLGSTACCCKLFVTQSGGIVLFPLHDDNAYIPLIYGRKYDRNNPINGIAASGGTFKLPQREGIFFSAGRISFINGVSQLTGTSSLYLVSVQNPLIGMLLSNYSIAALFLCLAAVIGWMFLHQGGKKAAQPAEAQPARPAAALNLSPQEYKICVLIAAGRTNKEIAWELNLKEQTVKNYTHKIYTKLGISGRVSATLFINNLLQ